MEMQATRLRLRCAVVAGVGGPGPEASPQNSCSHGAVSPCRGSRGEHLDTARRPQGAWFGWWPWIASLGIFLLWVIGGILSQPGFFDEVVMREFMGRFGETIHRPQPLYFYLPHLLHKFAPWSVLIIAVAIADLHRENGSCAQFFATCRRKLSGSFAGAWAA